MTVVYVVFVAKDNSESAIFPADTEQWHLLSHTVDDEPMELVAIYSDSNPEEGGFEFGKKILGY